MIIYRMLEECSPDSYCLISPEVYDFDRLQPQYAQALPGTYHHLPPAFRLKRGHRFGLSRLRESVNIPLAVVHYGRRVADIIRRERCDALVACTGDVTHLPAGLLASRLAHVPFYAYIFDHYSYREWQNPSAAFWARRFEPWVIRKAAAVISPNEILRDELRGQYGVEAEVIHNSFDISPYEKNAQPPASPRRDEAARETDDEVKIVYTGDVYEAHYDAFRNLLAALESLGRPGVKLHLYTDRPPEELAAHGIKGPVVHHPHHAMAEMPRIQMEADALFLPLAFDSPYPDLVRTSATTKLGEYLAARRPVLVHAPPDSFVSWYFRKHECGVVVDRLDPALLAESIGRLLDDVRLQQGLGERAWARSLADFDIRDARAAFAGLIKRGTGKAGDA